MALQPGDRAPNFSLPSSTGGAIALEDLRGKKVVLYFYPKDNTPGCTKEACGFRDAKDSFGNLGAIVLGVSDDKLRTHGKFARKYNLAFPLLSDEERKVANLYGTWGEKSMYGRAYMGMYRTTFLIDEQGVIQKIWSKVKPEGHADEVLKELTAN